MKAIIFFALLTIGLGGMWYKGQLEGVVELRPDEVGLPSLKQIPSLHEVALPQTRDINKATIQETRQAKVSEFITQNINTNSMSLDDAAKTGDLRAWLASHQVKEEKNEIDKLMNFLSRGKYE